MLNTDPSLGRVEVYSHSRVCIDSVTDCVASLGLALMTGLNETGMHRKSVTTKLETPELRFAETI